MTGKRFLAIAAFMLLISVCGCAQTLEYRLNSVLDEYAAAKYPQTEKPSTGETKSFIERLKKGRQESAKTMEPYAARILSIEGEAAKTVAEIAREDSEELWRITKEEVAKKGSDYEKFRSSENIVRLSRRTNLSIYTLEKMGQRGADALASLLKEPLLGYDAANSLGLLGQKEILWRVFEDKNAAELERANAAYALILFFKEKKLIPFLVDSLLQDDKNRRVTVSHLLCSVALEEFPEETIPPLLKAIEQGRGSKFTLMNFYFLEKRGVDLQKGIRLHTPGKEEKEMTFIYPTEPLPEEKIKSFLNKLKPEEKEKELLIEVGCNVTYKTFDRVMSLCEEAGIYKIKLGAHKVSLNFKTIYLLEPLTLCLAKPLIKPAVHYETLFVEISPVSDEKEKEKGIRYLLKPCQNSSEGKIVHPQFQITNEDVRSDKGLREFEKFLNERYNEFHPRKDFESLPVVFAPAPDISMEVLLPMIEEIRVRFYGKDINFLHHTRGCDWERAIRASVRKVK